MHKLKGKSVPIAAAFIFLYGVVAVLTARVVFIDGIHEAVGNHARGSVSSLSPFPSGSSSIISATENISSFRGPSNHALQRTADRRENQLRC
jgi:hypothetical protein